MTDVGKFIYVFEQAAVDKLLAGGYTLLKSDDRNLIYVFENPGDITKLKFDLSDFEFAYSDTLTF